MIENRLYALLGVSKSASEATIRHAYRQLVKKAHPDRGGDPEYFVEITTAYNTLLDPELRKEYDLAGEIRNDNALVLQERAIGILAEAFESVLEAGASQIEIVDITRSVGNVIQDGLSRLQAEQQSTQAKLSVFHKVRDRIKRNDSEKNVFVQITDARIAKLSKEHAGCGKEIRAAQRALEELEHYETIIEVIRTMQAGAYGGTSTNSGFFQFFSLTPT